MKTLAILIGLMTVVAAPSWAAEDFTGTKEVRLIHGDLGSPKAKTVVITDKAKIENLVGTIKLEKKEPCTCDHIQHAVFVKEKGEITVSLCDHCFDIGKSTYQMPPEFSRLYAAYWQEASGAAAQGRQFLVDLLDPSMNLLPEFRGSKTYWLYHDNYLAIKVLQKSHPGVAQKIAKAMDGYGVTESGKIEIVFGEAKRPLPFRHFQLREVKQIGGKVVKTEVVTDKEMSGWEEYADLLFLAAIAEKEPVKARQHFQRGMAMWDGKGFKDRVVQTNGIYSTYKLALALVATARLGEHPEGQAAILDRLLIQQTKDGGWITDYDKSGKPVGVANVETTSLAILAVEAANKAKQPEIQIGATTSPTALGNLGVTLAADKREIMLGKSVECSVQQRIEARRFPSVFQAWNPATNVHDESPLDTLARHDLVWHAPQFFRLKWNNLHIGLADGFDKECIETAKAFRQKLMALNPNLILIAEIRYRDAHKSYLPDGHSWWLRDKQGRIVPGWEEGGFLCLDFHNPEFRRQVAKQAKAAVVSGVVDGVMLDWWSDDDSRLALVKEIREAIGDHALILCNANDRTTPQTAQFINGYFMECYRSKAAEEWRQIADTLVWAEKNLRSPRVNCLETWFQKSRDDLHLMRATTTLALTLSNGYCLFSDPNPLPTPDHLHNWYPFWNKSLGRPVSGGTLAADGTMRREFDNGTVVYNPMGNKSVDLVFPQPRTSVATGRTATEHQLASSDGDIYLMPKEQR